jgi:hypothetical protein
VLTTPTPGSAAAVRFPEEEEEEAVVVAAVVPPSTGWQMTMGSTLL